MWIRTAHERLQELEAIDTRYTPLAESNRIRREIIILRARFEFEIVVAAAGIAIVSAVSVVAYWMMDLQ